MGNQGVWPFILTFKMDGWVRVKDPALGPVWPSTGEGNRDLHVFGSNADDYSISRPEKSIDSICRL